MFSLSVYLGYFCNLTTHIININKGLTLHRVTPGDVLHNIGRGQHHQPQFISWMGHSVAAAAAIL